MDSRKTFTASATRWIDGLREAGVQDSLIRRIAGHEDGAVTFSIYGSRSPLKAMSEVITKIDMGTQS